MVPIPRPTTPTAPRPAVSHRRVELEPPATGAGESVPSGPGAAAGEAAGLEGPVAAGVWATTGGCWAARVSGDGRAIVTVVDEAFASTLAPKVRDHDPTCATTTCSPGSTGTGVPQLSRGTWRPSHVTSSAAVGAGPVTWMMRWLSFGSSTSAR